jgi:hypothetical protein
MLLAITKSWSGRRERMRTESILEDLALEGDKLDEQ